jgi:hypothetical protein
VTTPSSAPVALVTGRNPDTLAAAKQALPDDVVVLRADASA